MSHHITPIQIQNQYSMPKGIAEQVVRDIIPDTTIVRPAPMYGRRFIIKLFGTKS